MFITLMSKGMCCSASQVICSASSAAVISGHGDLADDDALPVDADRHVARRDLLLVPKIVSRASMTAARFMMCPSTMVCAGSGAMP